jgi:DNA repair photolyase
MKHKQIKVDFLLNQITKKDTLFVGDYTVDPYQNCEFGCLYCDSSLDDTVYIKANSSEIFEKELDSIDKSRIIVGSVHDPYQKAEETYQITKKILETIAKKNFSCHILTKSKLVLRDINIISKTNNPIVTISLCCIDNNISNIFEENVITPLERLEIVKKLSERGIKTGVAIIPILPFITENEIEKIIKEAKKHNAEYIIYKHLELKGDQKQTFFEILKNYFPDLLDKYYEFYKDDFSPSREYINKIKNSINQLFLENKIKNKIEI